MPKIPQEVLTEEKNHMTIPWHHYVQGEDNVPITEAGLTEKASVIGRTGLMLLSCGTGAWRVRASMNELAKALGVTCTVDIGLLTIHFDCFDGDHALTQSLSLHNTGVNTSKLFRMEKFVRRFRVVGTQMTGEELHTALDRIEAEHGRYSPVLLGLASALACCGFTFLLGGGPIEMLLAFVGAGVGNAVRAKLTAHKFTLFMCTALSVAAGCLTYAVLFRVLQAAFHVAAVHQAGYICAMLFIIPGFPFITSGIDMAKLDLRSGLERLSYALIIIAVATLCAWIMALLLHLKPVAFAPLGLTVMQTLLLRLLFSFCGVFGFSIMFNSAPSMAATAACIGAVANTLRLELVDLCGVPAAAAAFAGALTAGLLASLLKNKVGFPRISLTVPSIVIMVPGLYFYRGIYNLGLMSLTTAATWLAAAVMIVVSLPLGLIFARILTDRTFRLCT